LEKILPTPIIGTLNFSEHRKEKIETRFSWCFWWKTESSSKQNKAMELLPVVLEISHTES